MTCKKTRTQWRIISAFSTEVIYMCLFNKQKMALLYTFDFHMQSSPYLSLVSKQGALYKSGNEKFRAGQGNSFNVECSQNQDFFICSNNAVKSENYSPFLHVLLPLQFSCLIINCRVQWLVSSTFHTGRDRLKTPAYHQPVSAYH